MVWLCPHPAILSHRADQRSPHANPYHSTGLALPGPDTNLKKFVACAKGQAAGTPALFHPFPPRLPLPSSCSHRFLSAPGPELPACPAFCQTGGVKPEELGGQLDRLRVAICGAVQGVGFRPFVHRLASELSLAGWVNNSSQGLFIEAEGRRPSLEQFLSRLEAERPPNSFIQSLESSWLDPVGYKGFEIRSSDPGGAKTALVLPDLATCPDCFREILDPANRRYQYPFTNCTNCGPRFSIITALPYDRANTTMAGFAMCPACRAEYENPDDRRFHAQPNACPACGPQLQLWAPGVAHRAEHVRPSGHAALIAACDAIRSGQILALKGLGGFHLIVDARSESAVERLRQRKHREEKPLALMCPSVESIGALCELSPSEERVLRSPQSPIVLLRRRQVPAVPPGVVARSVAPGNPTLGAMLPYTPLHHLLLSRLGFPVVATSGNLSDEPICIDEQEALDRLSDIADLFLVHNRPIARHVDDSVVRVMLGRELLLRRARGYAPLPVLLKTEGKPRHILAVGAHLKNAVGLAIGPQVFISQHIGDLETEQANTAFRRVIADFQRLYAAAPTVAVADLHPDYLSTRYAQQLGSATLVQVQHHIAHVLSCMAENELSAPLLGVAWDGTGLGLDGTIWGGEFFLVTRESIQRVAHFRPFRLPGGEKAVKEPRRSALGLLHELSGSPSCASARESVAVSFSSAEAAAVETMLQRGINAPFCCSVGRLFDAVAALAGLRQMARFEGQAAMELEFALEGVHSDEAYSLGPDAATGIIDWTPLIEAILRDKADGAGIGLISARFHNGLAEAIVRVARRTGERRVVLSGGCFQNRYLTERTVQRLRAEGFQAYWHQRVPPNDGGIALGQIMAAVRGA